MNGSGKSYYTSVYFLYDDIVYSDNTYRIMKWDRGFLIVSVFVFFVRMLFRLKKNKT